MARIYRGHEGIARLHRAMSRSLRGVPHRFEEFLELGDERVVVVSSTRRTGKGSGTEIETRTAIVWTLRDGKVDRLRRAIPRPRRSPRSRRAVGVGDVAGERGDRAAGLSRRSNEATSRGRCALADPRSSGIGSARGVAGDRASIGHGRRASVTSTTLEEHGQIVELPRRLHRRRTTGAASIAALPRAEPGSGTEIDRRSAAI